jgi:hypothetical protein
MAPRRIKNTDKNKPWARCQPGIRPHATKQNQWLQATKCGCQLKTETFIRVAQLDDQEIEEKGVKE